MAGSLQTTTPILLLQRNRVTVVGRQRHKVNDDNNACGRRGKQDFALNPGAQPINT